MYPVSGTAATVNYKIKVEASTVTSCAVPDSTSATVTDTTDGVTTQQVVITEKVSPAFTDQTDNLMMSALQSGWQEISSNALLGVAFSTPRCAMNPDRVAMARLRVPTCGDDFYAEPQCRSDCEKQSNSCILFKQLDCSGLPTSNCKCYYDNGCPDDDDGAVAGVIIFVILLCCICGCVGAGIYYCCCQPKPQQSMHQVQAVGVAQPQQVQPTGYAQPQQPPGYAQPVATAHPVNSFDKSGAPAPLPPNWAPVVDPASGRTYYHNTATNATSWEVPTQ